MAENSFHIDGRISKDKDIQRAYQFELEIDSLGDLKQDFTYRCRSATIPGRGNDPIVSTFMGQDRYYPGRPTWGGNTLSVEIEEYDDQVGLKALQSWHEKMFISDPKDDNGGVAMAAKRKGYTRDIKLKMYKYNGEPMDKCIVFYSCFLETVGEVSLNYTSNDSVKYTAGFKWDYWLLTDN
jgi:hypothetical protein